MSRLTTERKSYIVVWGSWDNADNGVYDKKTDKQLLSGYQVGMIGLEMYQVSGYSDSEITRTIKRYNEWRAS